MNKAEELVGEKIDHYLITEYLAQGDMTDVYLAVDQNLNRQVAFKVLLSENLADPDVVERFRREAIAGGKLVHPNIVQMYGVGNMADGRPYLTAQYITGGSLERRLWDMDRAGQRYEIEDALALVRQVAAALGVAHKAGIIHRDVATSNILLRPDGSPVLTDMGLSLVRRDPRLTQTGQLIGTPEYMSPEQADSLEVDGRSDLYSVGIILYELLAGQQPFTAESPWAVVFKQMTEMPQPLRELTPDLTEETYQVVDTCLQKVPNDRYQSADELVTALDRALAAEKGPDKSKAAALAAAAAVVATAVEVPEEAVVEETIVQPPPATPAAEAEAPKETIVGQTVVSPAVAAEATDETVIAPTEAGDGLPPVVADETVVSQPEAPAVETEPKRRSWWLLALIPILLVLLCGGVIGGYFLIRGLTTSEAEATAVVEETTVTAEPTVTPSIEATSTTEMDTEVLLPDADEIEPGDPEDGAEVAPDQEIEFTWESPIPLADGLQYVVYLTDGDQEFRLGEGRDRPDGSYYLSITPGDHVDEAGAYEWFLVVEDIDSGQRLVEGRSREIIIMAPTPTATNTPRPTSTPRPTNTPRPTSTSRPTNTPTRVPPTNTPIPPTNTPIPPTNTPQPPPATNTPQPPPPTSTPMPPPPATATPIP